MTLKRALFLTNYQHIGEGKGGVQRCTAEYLDTIEAMGLGVRVVRISNDQRLDTKVLRQLNSSPYFRPVAQADLARACEAAQQADLIFLNQVALCAIAKPLRQVVGPKIPIIVLSHGCEITDLLHLARLHQKLPLSGRLRPTPKQALAQVLTDEITTRTDIDGVIGLSEYDANTETWLGSRRSTWLPRTVKPEPLEWSPVLGRFGFVGTLDHAPSLEGLVQVLEEIERQKARQLSVRVVGAPPRLGRWLAERFPSVSYLGALNDADLNEEACSWNGFLNPIFCQARGCSTKLAMALNWQIPILTTPIGRRGYLWSEGSLAEAEHPRTFVEAMIQAQASEAVARTLQDQVRIASLASPTLPEVAKAMRAFCMSDHTC
ncbi:glycosyltransferase [Aquidulcibacter sp.]|uniref:glycosyltransferase n=1 Tax=Aquidulcibacter sp. TaxID=2052990 RepID=UPI0025B92C80|nr:glycosyltransferase [Aquidulcibacter sp.]MCA3693463.1 glycosyltransferase [Aquidulcibacter sp.]